MQPSCMVHAAPAHLSFVFRSRSLLPPSSAPHDRSSLAGAILCLVLLPPPSSSHHRWPRPRAAPPAECALGRLQSLEGGGCNHWLLAAAAHPLLLAHHQCVASLILLILPRSAALLPSPLRATSHPRSFFWLLTTANKKATSN